MGQDGRYKIKINCAFCYLGYVTRGGANNTELISKGFDITTDNASALLLCATFQVAVLRLSPKDSVSAPLRTEGLTLCES